MNRYANIQEYRTATGTRYRGVTRYPEIPASEDDVYVIAADGDRLDNLAYQFYGDSSLYWIIASANPDQIYNSLYPVLGTQLRIPFPVQKIISSFNAINNG